jgi:D-alanyl-lipoteichoic acid acyltransferase DltB (MBOAT superfamily)
MLFNSPVFIFVFLPITVVLYALLNRRQNKLPAKSFMVLASLFFYSYWNPIYLPLILASIFVNFAIGRSLARSYSDADDVSSKGRKVSLVLGILFNVGLLAYFKYVDFFIENFNFVFSADAASLNIVLPLAISFFTFQQIAYLADCYKEGARQYSLIDYALFVSFFPQLIAGPIVHHKEMMPQFLAQSGHRVNWDQFAQGLTIFCLGLFKKVFIADTFAIWADAGFDSQSTLSFFEAWGASLSYTFQLYYDFSGYTDMAIGAALLFGIRLPVNFNSPYKALDIQDFWRRWHITLSNGLRDYVYIPLGGNRAGEGRMLSNLMLTFLIGGLWHGAGWTFVIWGALHGLALVLHRLWSKAGFVMNRWVAWFITFMFVNLAWVFFRAESVESAFSMLAAMADVSTIQFGELFLGVLHYLFPAALPAVPVATGALIVTITTLEHILIFGLVALMMPNSIQVSRYVPYIGRYAMSLNLKWSMVLGVMFFISCATFIGNPNPSKFLYFNF